MLRCIKSKFRCGISCQADRMTVAMLMNSLAITGNRKRMFAVNPSHMPMGMSARNPNSQKDHTD